MTLFLFVAFVTLATSFLCSLLEAVLYSVPPSRIEVMRTNDVFGAERFARFRADIDEPIAAILTVNTIAHTAGAAVLGSLVGGEAGAHGSDLAVFTAVFTLAVLFLSEIVPKSIGVQSGPALVPFLVWPLQLMIWAVWPISRACRRLMRALASSEDGAHSPTEDEILAMSSMAASGGDISASELTWVRNALQLDKVSARDLMTPRTVVEWVRADETVRDIRARTEAPRASRLPVIEGDDPDRIVGMVFRRELLEGAIDDGFADKTMGEIAMRLDFVPEGMKGPRLLARFLRRRRHMAAVIDEYGGFEGIVTLEDVLECLLGAEIVDEHDEHRDLQELARVRAQTRNVGDETGGDDAAGDASAPGGSPGTGDEDRRRAGG